MQKGILGLMLLILLSTVAHGAEWKRLGLQAGFVSANLTGRSKTVDTDPRFGRFARLSVGVAFDDTYNFESGIVFIEKGWKVSASDTTDAYFLDYLELPVTIRINLRQAPVFNTSAFVGLVWGYNIRAQRTTRTASTEETVTLDWVRKDEFSVAAGLGVAFPTRFGIFTIDARYQLGFSTVVKNPDNNPDINIDWRNETIGLVIGYMFR